MISWLLLVGHLFKGVYFARYQWQIFYEFIEHRDTSTSGPPTINLILNEQGFLLFLQGEPLKPSSGEYSEEFFFKLMIYFKIALLVYVQNTTYLP